MTQAAALPDLVSQGRTQNKAERKRVYGTISKCCQVSDSKDQVGLEQSGKAWELGLDEWIYIWRETSREDESTGGSKVQQCIQQ